MIIALIRTIILYLFIIFGIRLLGKRQIGQLEPSELVLSLIIADLASVPMQDFGIPLIIGIIPILTLLSISTILSTLTAKSIRIRSLLCGRPSYIIQDGKVLPDEMKKNRLTADELMEELRLCGCVDIRKIKCAILETGGRLSVIPYDKEQAVTAEQMNINPIENGLPVIVVNDGHLIKHNLTDRNLDVPWLNRQLEKNGIQNIKDLFLLTVDEKNNIYYTLQSNKAS